MKTQVDFGVTEKVRIPFLERVVRSSSTLTIRPFFRYTRPMLSPRKDNDNYRPNQICIISSLVKGKGVWIIYFELKKIDIGVWILYTLGECLIYVFHIEFLTQYRYTNKLDRGIFIVKYESKDNMSNFWIHRTLYIYRLQDVYALLFIFVEIMFNWYYFKIFSPDIYRYNLRLLPSELNLTR